MEVLATRAGSLPAPLQTLKLGKTLGKGGFAVVFKGTLKAADGPVPVAVKVLHPEFSDESSAELRLFKDEAQLMLQLDHRNIIIAYGLLKLPAQFPGLEARTQPAYALVLELMAGGSLAGLMVKQLLAGAVPKYRFSQALGWATDVARALQYLHTGGKDGFPRIHRDIKLENVLLTAGSRTAKLADFGLQRAIFVREEQQQPMLVRRSQRPIAAAITPAARSGPAGPSRMALESERSSCRRSSIQQQTQPQVVAAPGGGAKDSASTYGVAAPGGGGEGVCVEEPPRNDGSLFYAFDGNGLMPLSLPNSPQPAASISPAASAQVPDPPEGLGRLLELEIGRRSTSMPQLGQQLCGAQTGAGVGLGVQLTANGGAQSDSLGPAVMPGQLLSAGSNVATSRKSLALTPPGPLTGPVSPRGPALLISSTSQIAARPSPLGPAAIRSQQGRPSSQVSVDVGSPKGCPEEPGRTSVSPRYPPMGAPPTPDLSQVGHGDRGACISDRGPGGPVEERASPAAGSGGCVPEPCGSILFSPADWPPSSRAVASSRLPTGPTSCDISPANSMRPSLASVRDVVPMLADEGHVGTGSLWQVPSYRAAPRATNARRLGGAIAVGPAAAVPASKGGPQGANGAGVGVSNGAGASGSRCRPHLLTLADANGGCDGDGSPQGAVRVQVAPAAPAQLPPPPLPTPFARVTSTTASPQAPRPAARPGPVAGSARRASSATGMAGGGAAVVGAGYGAVEAAGACLKALGDRGNVLDLRNRGDTRSAVFEGHLDAAVGRVDGGGGPRGDTATGGGCDPEASQPLQLSDLLHLRLGALQVSVRSVRSSASGVGLPRNGASGSSLLPSPRLAAGRPSAGAGAGAGAGAVAGGVWQQQGADAKAAVAARVNSPPARPRAGSLPGCLLEKSVGLSVKADFEEVFSLTGRTGSLMYLAPEAYKNEPYNDKVDVYSLGILIYELFGRTSITYTHISTKLPAFSRMLCSPDEFAERVAAGYRPPRTNQMAKMPPQLWELIEAAWHQDPVQRPDIDAVLEALEDLAGPLADAEAAESRGVLSGAACRCVIC